MTSQDMAHDFNSAMRALAHATQQAARGLRVLSEVIAENRERWLCEGEGQWPDKFSLLNRYVRTDLEPPFIINV